MFTGEAEEQALVSLNEWVEAQGLPRGQLSFEYTDPDTGEQREVFDLAWPDGLQEGLSQPVAVLLNEEEETLALASSAGFRCFTDIEGFKAYLMKEILKEALTALETLKDTRMDIDKMWRQLVGLPPEAQRQVTDVIAFLYARSRPSRLPKRSGKSKLAEEPFVGLWVDREDLRDSTTWVRQVRQREWVS